MLGQLKNGNSITLPDGTTVHKKDVCSADDPGPIFILLDIPSIEFLDSFKEKEHSFAKHQQTALCEDDIASLVVHFSPKHVMDSQVYQDFVNKFSKSTKHLVLNETNKYVETDFLQFRYVVVILLRFSGFISSHRIQIQLNQLNEKIFPILG